VDDENFTTEAFVHMLLHLLASRPAKAAQLVERLTGGRMVLSEVEASSLNVSTQVEVECGRPDIELRTLDHLVYVEVKVESNLHEGQLECYRCALGQSGFAQTSLVLLTRYADAWIGEAKPDVHVRWYQVADWLEELVERNSAETSVPGPVGIDPVQQFLEFLEGRGMTMDRVGYELVEGVRSLNSLFAMMGEALNAVELKGQRISGWQWWGYNTDKTKYSFFVTPAEPHIVRFYTWNHNIDRAKAEVLTIGRIWEEQGRLRWGQSLDLTSEEVHFFARSRASQMQCLESFLRTGVEIAQQIEVEEVADGQPLTDVSDMAEESGAETAGGV
jgi:hypothetical protein